MKDYHLHFDLPCLVVITSLYVPIHNLSLIARVVTVGKLPDLTKVFLFSCLVTNFLLIQGVCVTILIKCKYTFISPSIRNLYDS